MSDLSWLDILSTAEKQIINEQITATQGEVHKGTLLAIVQRLCKVCMYENPGKGRPSCYVATANDARCVTKGIKGDHCLTCKAKT